MREEKKAYRPHIDVRIYHITEKAIEYCELIVNKYDARAKQQELQLDLTHLDVTADILAILEGVK